MNKRIINILLGIFTFLFVGTSAFAVSEYFNGFETDTTGWFGSISQVASGTDGITSSDGSYHAVIEAGAYTQWGGYETAFPANGYVTEVDIYLDMSEADGSDKRFDYTSAVNTPADTHRRDFVFNIGTKPGETDQFVVSASNNALGWPSNPDRSPVTINQSGWYTFRHTFQDNGSGILEAVMEVLDGTGAVIGSWTLSDPTDIIGTTVGGNRYGWFPGSRFDFDTLAIDNSHKYDIIVDEDAPDVEITSPADGSEVSGTVDVYGSVTDENPWRYYTVVRDAANNIVAGPGTVYDDESFTNQLLFSWDTTAVDDGTYTIRLEARDEFNNKDAGSIHVITVEVNNIIGPPMSKDECKDGGWITFNNPTFKNQGQCVSYIQANEKAGKKI